MSCPDTIVVNGETYTKTPAPPKGKRVVLVLDRGWIFAGDLDESDGRLRMSRVVHVLSWQSGGFAGLCDDPTKAGAKLSRSRDLDAPADCELFRVPVGDSWGL